MKGHSYGTFSVHILYMCLFALTRGFSFSLQQGVRNVWNFCSWLVGPSSISSPCFETWIMSVGRKKGRLERVNFSVFLVTCLASCLFSAGYGCVLLLVKEIPKQRIKNPPYCLDSCRDKTCLLKGCKTPSHLLEKESKQKDFCHWNTVYTNGFVANLCHGYDLTISLSRHMEKSEWQWNTEISLWRENK